jgi:Plasmid pRiA4b ORF-3-like protein
VAEIYTLTIEFPSRGEEPWSRVFEVEETMDLADLHLYIQELIEFDNDHLFQFFIGRNWRDYRVVFGDSEFLEIGEVASLSTTMNIIFPLNGLKFFYLFDFGDSWLFRIKKGRKLKHKVSGVEYPRIIESVGENPEQYPMDDY